MKYFVILSNGNIIKFREQSSINVNINVYYWGRVCTNTSDSGLAFKEILVESNNIIASGELLEVEEDTAVSEALNDI